MTAGFNYNYRTEDFRQLHARTYGRCPTREFARTLAQAPLDFEPGAQYQYSLAHDVLAALVEVLSGQLFADYVKEHIFEKFYQGDPSHKGEGNGLGLPLARRIVRVCGGSIEVKSSENAGSEFTVIIPEDCTKRK